MFGKNLLFYTIASTIVAVVAAILGTSMGGGIIESASLL